MSLHTTVQNLSEKSQTAIQRLWDQHEAGDLGRAEFKALATAQLARDQVRASSVAVLALGAELSRQSRAVTSTPGTGQLLDDPEFHARRELEAQEHTQSYQQDPRKALGYAAGAAVMGAYQVASSRGLRDSGTEYFQRVPGPQACELCIDLGDIVLPVDQAESQYHHKGCQCTYKPISESDI